MKIYRKIKVAIPFSSGLCSFVVISTDFSFPWSQSLFHQVCVRSRNLGHGTRKGCHVAIPFSSGLCSFPPITYEVSQVTLSQSLFHQVCVRSTGAVYAGGGNHRRNPFFIRSVFVLLQSPTRSRRSRSQSLFHQVCVRSPLRSSKSLGYKRSQSLFHQVCVRSLCQSKTAGSTPGRNPFFIRSVFVRRVQREVEKIFGVAIPFSSGLCSFKSWTIYDMM